MIYFHPFFQGIMTLVMVAAWVMGMMRLRKPRADDPLRFRRKLHMKVGKVALWGILLGALGGFFAVYLATGRVFMTGIHGQTALLAALFSAMGLYTGLLMERDPGKSPGLPKVHGLFAAFALAFCLFQMRTGLELLDAIQKAAKAAG